MLGPKTTEATIGMARVIAGSAALVLFITCSVAGQSVIRNPSQIPDGVLGMRPSLAAYAPDGSLYVADNRSENIRVFDTQGSYQFSFDSPGKGRRQAPYINGLSVDADGIVHMTYDSTLATYSADGVPLSETRYRDQSIFKVEIGPGGERYAFVDGGVSLVDQAGGITPLIDRSDSLGFIDMSVGSDGRLAVLSQPRRPSESSAPGPHVQVYDPNGSLVSSFSANVPSLPKARGRDILITTDGVYLTDDHTGTVRHFSTTGDLIGAGHAIPLTSDLLTAPDGGVVALMEDARLIERIGPERFESDYYGVTRLRDRPPLTTGFYDGLLASGVDLDAGWNETTATTFVVPGTAGEMVDLDFHFVSHSASGFAPVFVYDVGQIKANPISDPARYFVEAIDAFVGFVAPDQRLKCHDHGLQGCDNIQEPNLLTTIPVAAGTEIGFLSYAGKPWITRLADDPYYFDLMINSARNHMSGFGGVEDPAYIDFSTSRLRGRSSPEWFLSSDPRANWGRMDQFVSFLSEDETLIGIEDLSLAGDSDAEFTDFMFRISTRLIPTPEPSAAILALGSLSLMSARPRRFRPDNRSSRPTTSFFVFSRRLG